MRISPLILQASAVVIMGTASLASPTPAAAAGDEAKVTCGYWLCLTESCGASQFDDVCGACHFDFETCGANGDCETQPLGNGLSVWCS